ncbi:uncharacterized protein RHO17_019919 [Thomomys bottae]
MSHFKGWKSIQTSQHLMSSDSNSIFHERFQDEYLPQGQMLQKAEGAQSTENKTKKLEDMETVEESPTLRKKEPQKEGKDWKLPIPLEPVYPPLLSSNLSTKALGHSWELPPPVAKSIRIPDLPKGPFQHLMDLKVERRLASWKERRNRFGDIDMHKCYPCGQIFSPFQALATTEMQSLVLPGDLLMSSHGQKLDASYFTDMTLQDLPLTSTELDLRKDNSSHSQEKAVSHMKTPLFPPIVNVTKYKDMK